MICALLEALTSDPVSASFGADAAVGGMSGAGQPHREWAWTAVPWINVDHPGSCSCAHNAVYPTTPL